MYLETDEYQECGKFYMCVAVARKKIKLLNTQYFNKDGEQIEEGD